MRFAIRCAAEAKVIVPRVNIPLAGLPNQLARRVLVGFVVFAKQVATLRGEQHRRLARPVTAPLIHVATVRGVSTRLEEQQVWGAPTVLAINAAFVKQGNGREAVRPTLSAHRATAVNVVSARVGIILLEGL